MNDDAGTSELMANMLLATGVLIGSVIILVVVAIVWYMRDAAQRAETDDLT